MDSRDLYKIIAEPEDSDAGGYVQLREESSTKPLEGKSPVQSFPLPVQSESGSKLKISLSQEQLRIKLSNSESLVKTASSKEKYPRKVSLQSPIKIKINKNPPAARKSITAKEGGKSKDLSLRITCKLCDNPFVDPRILSCLHTFCLGCIQKRIDLDPDIPRE